MKTRALGPASGVALCLSLTSPAHAHAALLGQQQGQPPGVPPAAATPAQDPLRSAPQDPEQKPDYSIIVTAQKWGEESVLAVPRSVTPVDAELIRDAGLRSIEQAARYVPNMLVPEFTARRLSFPFVRGIGSGQGDPAVGTFVDGVPQLSGSSTNLALSGLERIEFLRGPSGSLWGRNTIGGSIHMISKMPSWKPGADFGASFGNFAAQNYDVYATGPVVDDALALSFAGSHERRDGYTTNSMTGNDVDSRDSSFGRLQLLWTPNDDAIVRFTLHGERTRDGGFVLSDLAGLRANPYTINQDFEGETDRDLMAASMTWNQYGDSVDFVAITGVQGWDIDESADFDFMPIDGVRRFTNEDQNYVYQELRLESAGAAAASGPRWLIGASGFYSDSNRSATNEFRPGGAGILFAPTMVGSDSAAGSFEDWSASCFGQIGVRFGDGWDLSGALRYDYEEKSASINRVFVSGGSTFPLAQTRSRESYGRILPRGSITYHFDENLNAYLVAARGFKAGGFNLTAPTGLEAFGPEDSWTYEVGIKSEWFTDRLTTNVALFYIDWDDMQLSQFGATGGYVANAGRSSSQGVEVELAAQPLDELQLFGTAGYMDTEFDSYVDQYGNNAGNNLPFAPELTFGAGAQYSHELKRDLNAFARVDYFHVGEFFYDAGNRAAERYNLTNFRLGVRGKHWSLDGFLMNAFDEEYVPIAFQQNPSDPSMFVGSNGAPRTYGIGGRIVF